MVCIYHFETDEQIIKHTKFLAKRYDNFTTLRFNHSAPLSRCLMTFLSFVSVDTHTHTQAISLLARSLALSPRPHSTGSVLSTIGESPLLFFFSVTELVSTDWEDGQGVGTSRPIIRRHHATASVRPTGDTQSHTDRPPTLWRGWSFSLLDFANYAKSRYDFWLMTS